MFQRVVTYTVLTLLPATCLLADFSYEQSSQITGGMMAGAMKLAGAFSKQAREPMKSTVAVKGDRMVHLATGRASIIDLAKETITEVDFQKKTYSVMTFAEMTRMMDEASQKMQQSKEGGDVKWKVSMKETGQAKDIAGFHTKEVILQIEMENQDPKSEQKGSMTITCDMWMAPQMAGYGEIAEFYKRMSQKVTWTPGGNAAAAGRSDLAKAMAEAVKEGAKLNGVPVYQVTKIGAQGQPGAEGAAPQQQPQQAPPQEQEATVEKPTAGGALGGALGRLGGLGGLGRRKKQDQPPAQTQQQPSGQQAPSNASGSLMETTSELSGFSAASVDASKFEVPAGFKQVQNKR